MNSFELTNDARTRKIRAGCDLRHDVRDIYTYIYIYREREKFHSKLVYVGLAQAHPTNHNLVVEAVEKERYLPAISHSWNVFLYSGSIQL